MYPSTAQNAMNQNVNGMDCNAAQRLSDSDKTNSTYFMVRYLEFLSGIW